MPANCIDAASAECADSRDHNCDFKSLDELQHPRFAEAVGDLARISREQKERCDEYRPRQRQVSCA